MTHKILIVEDDPDINRALRIRLESCGYEVCSAEDGLLGVCTAAREKPDLLLLDITLPCGDGFSIVERVRAMEGIENTPVMFLTASKRPEYREIAKELGASAFMEKPFEWLELRATIEGVLSGQSEQAA